MKKSRSGDAEEIRTRKRWGCLFAGFLAFILIILPGIILAVLFFRIRPPVPEGLFFAQDNIGYLKINMDILDSPSFEKQLKSASGNDQETDRSLPFDPVRFRSFLDIFLHQNHYFYIYDHEYGNSDYLLVIDLKRLPSVVRTLFNEDSPRVSEIPDNSFNNSHCYSIETANEKKRFAAVTKDALLITASWNRLERSLEILKEKNEKFSPSADFEKLTPSPFSGELVSGYALWEEEILLEIQRIFLSRYPRMGKHFHGALSIIAKNRPQNIQIQYIQSSSGAADYLFSINYEDAAFASETKENLVSLMRKNNLETNGPLNFEVSGASLKIEISSP